VRVHMIGAVLGVVFDDKDRRVECDGGGDWFAIVGHAQVLLDDRRNVLERFPKRLNRDSLGGANMIQAAYWQEASMDGEAIFGGLA